MGDLSEPWIPKSIRMSQCFLESYLRSRGNVKVEWKIKLDQIL